MIDVHPTSSVYGRLCAHAAERDAYLACVTERSLADPRIVAAWLYGSLARVDEDALSDIDVRLVLRDQDSEGAIGGRYMFLASIGEPIMIQEAPQNRPPGGAYNMAWYAGSEAPHAIDFTWSVASTTQIPTGVRIVHNVAGLASTGEEMEFSYQPVPTRDRREEIRQALHGFWSMLLVCAKYAARNPCDHRMELLRWTVPQLREVQQFAGVEPGPSFEELDAHSKAEYKIPLLRTLATEGCLLADPLAKRAIDAPLPFEPHAWRYLDFIEAVILEVRRGED